jgi:hypothetical protein
MEANMADQPTKSIRDQLRTAIFSNNAVATKRIMFFDAEIEIRQPSTGEVLATKDDDNSQRGLVSILVRYAYVPGTNEKVFEEADADAILALPFGPDMLRVNEAIAELTKIDVAGKSVTSGETV